MAYQWNHCFSISTNRTNGTNGRVECTPTKVEAIENILTPHSEMHFTDEIPLD